MVVRLAELLPDVPRLAANTLVSSLNFTATIAGPAIAGVLVTYVRSKTSAAARHRVRPIRCLPPSLLRGSAMDLRRRIR